jgi:hypothetical protein
MHIVPASATTFLNRPITVTIVISNVANLGGFQFTLAYSPTLVIVEDVTLGDFLGSSGRTAQPLGPAIDNSAGSAAFGGFTMGSPLGPSGAGVVARIRLLPKAISTASLRLVRGQATTVLGGDIPLRMIDGNLTIVACLGDFDGDADVDIVDVQSVAGRWNSSVGSPTYDHRYDLDGDGDIDIVDVQTVAGRWNTRCQ